MGCATAGPIMSLPDISNDPDYTRCASISAHLSQFTLQLGIPLDVAQQQPILRIDVESVQTDTIMLVLIRVEYSAQPAERERQPFLGHSV